MMVIMATIMVMFILRLAVCLTAQAGIPSLRHRHVLQRLPDVRRNQDLHTPNLPLHLLGVDLTEVAVLVLHLHVPEHHSQQNLNDLTLPVEQRRPTGQLDFRKMYNLMSF